MANLIQKHFYPREIENNALLYNSCSLVISNYCPEFPLTDENIVALCDSSLLSEFPVQAFFVMLDKLKKSKEVIIPDFFYNCMMKETKCFIDNKHVDFEQYIRELIKQCKDSIDLLYGDKYFKNINNWIYDTFSAAMKYRIKRPTYISDLMKINVEPYKNPLEIIDCSIISKLGYPLTIQPNNGEMAVLLVAEGEVFNCLFNLLCGKSIYSCSMVEICKQVESHRRLVDNDCSNVLRKVKLEHSILNTINECILKKYGETTSKSIYSCMVHTLWSYWGLTRYIDEES